MDVVVVWASATGGESNLVTVAKKILLVIWA